ncbi:transcription factor bHLH61-like [Rutidosis leptorrhynchoides]|uniref:transcription factor bHLH61-like n=1 Tax=Rutidosis leptorrhynchoides TaxID=125765 RepID=UPI003A99A7C1
MVSREHKRSAAALREKLQLLRSITNSHAVNDTSIIADASNYIKELKQRLEILNQDIYEAAGQTSLPVVNVETLPKGFLINVFSDKNCQRLLVSILEAFEELGLEVLEATASCINSFRFQAVGGENEVQSENIDAEVVKQAVLRTIKNWSQGIDP